MVQDEDLNKDHLDVKTRLAIDRTILANTRTFSAWVRTGLSSVLAGFAVVKFMGDNRDYQFFVSLIGILFVTIGIGIYIFGYLNFRISCKKLIAEDEQKLSLSLSVLLIITLSLILASLFIMVLLLLYR